jgi:hypothetical protein
MTDNARTITGSDWRRAIEAEATKPEEINNTVNRCMSELSNLNSLRGRRVGHPWTEPYEDVLGAVWASVPNITGSFKDFGGGWVVPGSRSVTPNIDCSLRYIRLSPAPPDAEVQYGFCVLRWDRFEEFVRGFLLVDGEFPGIKCTSISSKQDALLRIDKMTVAALRVAHRRSGNRASDRFRELLGTMELGDFMVDMSSKCYLDSQSASNVLSGRSPQYAEMMGIVINEAYPGFREAPKKTDPSGLRRFVQVYSLDQTVWHTDYVHPGLLNVVMPEPIFRAIDRNMEAGIPPIVPQYVTPDCFMFNGNWDNPCTGLHVILGTCERITGEKILGGIVGTFNTDRHGYVSYWPFEANPPQEWVDLFVRQLVRLGEETQPVSLSDRIDLALLHARDIPVMMNIGGGSGPVLKYKKLVELVKNSNNHITGVVTRDCNASGRWLDTVNPATGHSDTSPTGSTTKATGTDDDGEDTDECPRCGEGCSSDYISTCTRCADLVCDDCMWVCESCDENFCQDCWKDHPRCQRCPWCEVVVLTDSMEACEGCNIGLLCGECLPRDNHECAGGEVES